ncbi:MAG: ABC transporter substrate-binding protein [Chloroflexi bacterium]|nr:ABC transporter substrate-binding protein [Chloroflexota bacterium]
MRFPPLFSRRRVLALVSASAAFAAVPASRVTPFPPNQARALVQEPDLETISVALDWYPNANHAGLYLAQERGYYAEEGLAPDFYTPSDPTTVLQTVGAGRDTFGISYQTDVLLARAAGVPVVSVLALVQTPLQGIMVLTDSGITRPGDLVGKTVGYPGIPSQEAFLATMLEDDGATIDDVELVNIGFDLVPGLASGRVDAALGAFWTHEPILAEEEGYPTEILKVDDWGVPPYYELVIVASEATVDDRPDVVERFLRATRRGYEDAMADPAAAIAALRAASPDLNVPVEEAGIALLAPAWTAGDAPFGTQTAARWDAYAAWMAERGLIPADLDVAAAWQGDLLPTAGTPVP